MIMMHTVRHMANVIFADLTSENSPGRLVIVIPSLCRDPRRSYPSGVSLHRTQPRMLEHP